MARFSAKVREREATPTPKDDDAVCVHRNPGSFERNEVIRMQTRAAGTFALLFAPSAVIVFNPPLSPLFPCPSPYSSVSYNLSDTAPLWLLQHSNLQELPNFNGVSLTPLGFSFSLGIFFSSFNLLHLRGSLICP